MKKYFIVMFIYFF